MPATIKWAYGLVQGTDGLYRVVSTSDPTYSCYEWIAETDHKPTLEDICDRMNYPELFTTSW